MHVGEQGGPWVTPSHCRKVKNASWNLRCSHDVWCSARGSGKGGNWENGSTRALQLQLWRASSLGQTQCFAKETKLTS